MTFSDAASCFATVAALLIDEELLWCEGVNGVCLVISPRGHSVKLWSGSANNHGLAPISSVIEQLNVTLVEHLRDPVTFHLSKKRSTSPLNGASPEATSIPEPVTPPPQPSESKSESLAGAVSAHHESNKKGESNSDNSGNSASPKVATNSTEKGKPKKDVKVNVDVVPNIDTPDLQEQIAGASPKTKKEKKKKKEKPSAAAGVSPSSSAEAKAKLTPKEARANALAAAERAFAKDEGSKASDWNRERSIAWLWLLAFPLVYIVIGWLFCIVMNKTNPGAYPQQFLF